MSPAVSKPNAAAPHSTGRIFDPIAMEVFSNRLLSITEDMGNTLVRASFSTNIKERKDCSVGLFDGQGRLIAQASHIPLHLGSLWGGVEAVLQRYPIEQMVDGDAFICNDPYLAGGTHMPDISIVTPVFVDGRVRFFAANIAHHSDVGGAVPGSISGTLRTVFAEGLRIPVIRLVEGGSLNDDLLFMIAHNTRDPEERTLDLKVQVATNERGKQMALQLVGQMGMDRVQQSIDDLLGYTRRRLQNRVREITDGRFSAKSYLDEDGLGGDPVAIRANVEIKGDRLHIDFSGSDPQARGAMNVARSALHATVYYVVKTLLDPELLPNSGFFDAIDVSAPLGSIVNPKFPGAVGARSITCNKVARAIFGAFAGLLPPERAMGAGHDSVPTMVFSGQRGNRGTFVYLETIGGGAGALADRDGMDCIQVHMTNTSNLPAEALEYEYPLIVDEYALVEDSGGAGTYRGGSGIARQVSAATDGIVFSVRSDGHVMGAPGVFGGKEGRTARLIRNFGRPDQEDLHSKVSLIPLKRGESMRLETGGGAGYGPPDKRPLKMLAADVRGGKISKAAAIRDYGEANVAAALKA